MMAARRSAACWRPWHQSGSVFGLRAGGQRSLFGFQPGDFGQGFESPCLFPRACRVLGLGASAGFSRLYSAWPFRQRPWRRWRRSPGNSHSRYPASVFLPSHPRLQRRWFRVTTLLKEGSVVADEKKRAVVHPAKAALAVQDWIRQVVGRFVEHQHVGRFGKQAGERAGGCARRRKASSPANARAGGKEKVSR